MASPRSSDAEVPGGDASQRRRRADSAEDEATGAARPALKRLKLDSDDADIGVTDTSSVASTGEPGSATVDEDEEDDDTDDMDLDPTQPTAILPDDDDDGSSAIDGAVEVPSTPPPVQLTAAALARQARASPALRIDPSAKVGTIATTARPMLVADVVFRLKFPLLSDKTRLLSPVQRDAVGQAWRVTWFPHGQLLDGEFVGVFVEMVVDDDADSADDLDPSVASANGHTTTAVRHTVVEISILDPHDATVRKLTERSSVVLFDRQNLEFGVDKLVRRTQLSNPSNALVDADGDVTVEVRLHFVEAIVLRSSVSTETMELDGELEARAVSPMDDDDDDLLVGTTPVVTPTVSGLATLVTMPTTPSNHDVQLLLHDSKQETGMVGLKNQGATCYMNSLLQTLFHLLAFRHAVYETPTDREDTNDSVSLALQRVFYRLQTQTKAVSTKELTRSFGWSQMDAFMQHDVQELYRILCDRLEEKMKNTKVDNAIKKLFEGKVRSFVQCVNVDFQSFRDESFYDLQLDVKGCKDIYESFRKYVEIEMLENENQYEAEGHGKQDAKKGVQFVHFPPVLNIQLKRFEYDPMRDGMVKIHDRFEYPKTLVLDEFAPKQPLENGGTKSTQLVYHLHSVLVHSGDVHGGHYYVFIRPAKNLAESDEWFRFDDDQISRADEHTAIEGNYGSLGAAVNPTGGSSPSTPLYGSLLSPEITPREGSDSVMEFRSLGDGDGDGDGISDVVYSGPAAVAPISSSNPSSLLLPAARSFASAYMLVYVRDGANDVRVIQDEEEATEPVVAASLESESIAVEKDEAPHNNSPNDVAIPESLLARFHEEEKASARRKKLQQTEHLYMTFRIASDSSIAKLKKITKNIDFSSFNNNHGLRIRIKRTAPIRQLYARIYQRTGVPVARQRLWKVITRENRTHRPDTCISKEMLDLRAEALIDDDASPKTPVRMYLQIVDEEIENTAKKSSIFRHFWTEFTPPEEEEKPVNASVGDGGGQAVDADDDDDLLEEGSESDVKVIPAHNIQASEILLFIKLYDTKKKLGDRLEYMGNILFDARQTGRELAAYLKEALHIPASTELTLYEEIQPVSVSEINLAVSLETAEIQHGDIICYQLLTDEGEKEGENGHQDSKIVERYPDVPSYFQYLLDRVDVLFYEFGHPEKEPLIVHLLFSHCYDDIIDELTHHLGIPPDKRLYLRLYQHSPLNQLPKKNPLRHSKYAGDRDSTLEDFLTEYSERTTIMYFEVLANPITEIESKKQVTVYLSSYDECFVDSTAPAMARRLDCLVSPSDGLQDLLSQIVNEFELDASTKLRACEVSHNGSLLLSILPPDAPLEKYWLSSTSTGYTTVNDVALFVETIPEDELREIASYTEAMETSGGGGDDEDEEAENRLFYFGVVHFNFQMTGQHWIHPHGVPCVTYFREQDTVGQVKERIRRRIGTSEEVFAKWELAVVKDIKASTVRDLLEPEAIDEFAMAKLEDLCGPQFENISNLGLEHADMKPSPPKYARRQEQGIKIRQS